MQKWRTNKSIHYLIMSLFQLGWLDLKTCSQIFLSNPTDYDNYVILHSHAAQTEANRDGLVNRGEFRVRYDDKARKLKNVMVTSILYTYNQSSRQDQNSTNYRSWRASTKKLIKKAGEADKLASMWLKMPKGELLAEVNLLLVN